MSSRLMWSIVGLVTLSYPGETTGETDRTVMPQKLGATILLRPGNVAGGSEFITPAPSVRADPRIKGTPRDRAQLIRVAGKIKTNDQ